MGKRRLTVSVGPELAEAATAAVREGRAQSVSGWVSDALAEKVARDARLAALAEAVAAYEAEHGEIGPDELDDQARADRAAAAGVRASSKRRRGAA